MALVAPILIILIGSGDRGELAFFFDQYDLRGILEGEWTQEHRVDDRENGRVRTDAQRQREHGDESESGPSRESAHRKADVLPNRPHEECLPGSQSNAKCNSVAVVTRLLTFT